MLWFEPGGAVHVHHRQVVAVFRGASSAEELSCLCERCCGLDLLQGWVVDVVFEERQEMVRIREEVEKVCAQERVVLLFVVCEQGIEELVEVVGDFAELVDVQGDGG